MSEKMSYTVIGANPEKLRIYDEICAAAFVNVFSLTKESEKICMKNFDPKNEEHLFVLGIVRGVAGSFGKKVCLDVNKFQLWKLNWGIDKDCRLLSLNKEDYYCAFDPNELLDFMRLRAVNACGEGFTFADIYNEYYNRKKVK